MNMKKWIAAALACSALALSACDGQSKDASSSAPKADKVYRVPPTPNSPLSNPWIPPATLKVSTSI